jgi:hypothetical protein
MQMQSGFRVAEPSGFRVVVADARARLKAVGGAAVGAVKTIGSRVNALIAMPWFFPAQVASLLAVLWLQQHGYLQIPITVCDWGGVGK